MAFFSVFLDALLHVMHVAIVRPYGQSTICRYDIYICVADIVFLFVKNFDFCPIFMLSSYLATVNIITYLVVTWLPENYS